MTTRRVTPGRIILLGALLLCLLRLQQSFVDDIELHVPSTSVSRMRSVSLFYTRYAFLTRPRPTYSQTRRLSSSTIFYLLIISGDIELNPGPGPTEMFTMQLKN